MKGRIDHLAIDLGRRRLYVAALGNGSVEAIDLDKGARVAGVIGLSEPQGLGYSAQRDELVVASGDGTVRFYRGADLVQSAVVSIGTDADNVRIDAKTGNIIVGYGDGALAVIEPVAHRVVGTVQLPSHPEGFRLDDEARRAFVNLPRSGKIAVADIDSHKVVELRRAAYGAHYPLQYDQMAKLVMSVYRLPSRLVITKAATGRKVQDISVCGDSDDLFQDARRKRLYISCGSGHVDVLEGEPGRYRRIARLTTSSGARTSLFVPQIDRFFVAARASDGEQPAILVFKPQPWATASTASQIP